MSITILVVDDEPSIVDVLTYNLEKAHYRVLVARDGVEALTLAHREQPDLIILDIQMPKRDGFAVFSDLKKDPATRDIPVIMLTGVTARTGLKFSAEDMGEYLGTEPEAYVEMHPDDAQQIGLNGEKRVRVTSRRGQIELAVCLTDRIRPGVVFIPFHFAEAAANVLTNAALDKVSGIPEYKVCAVRVEVVSEAGTR